MGQFLRLASGVDVTPLLLELHRSPALWDIHTNRQSYPNTPHRDTKTIFVRFRSETELSGKQSYNEQHRNVFWPAWQALPSLRPLVFNLMTRVAGVELGTVLITRLPPGGAILPHSDRGSWAAEYYQTKCHLVLAGSSLSRCVDDAVTMVSGDCWTFDNLLIHSVENRGDCDRICLIVSMRTER